MAAGEQGSTPRHSHAWNVAAGERSSPPKQLFDKFS